MPEGTTEASLQSVGVEDEREGLVAMKWVVTNHSGRPINGRPYHVSNPGVDAPRFVPPMTVRTTTGEEEIPGNTFAVDPEWVTTFIFRVSVAKKWSGSIVPCFFWETHPPELVNGRRHLAEWKEGRLVVSLDL